MRNDAATDLAVSLRAEPGTAPGTVVIDESAAQPTIRLLHYGADHFQDEPVAKPRDLAAELAKDGVLWIDVCGLGSSEVLIEVRDLLGMHPLVLEDVVNVYQRPKVEEYADHLFLVTRMPHQRGSHGDGSHDAGDQAWEQVSLFIGSNFVATFQERAGDCLDPVRARIREGKGRIRTRGPDYLAYAIVDAITDSCFPLLEEYGEDLAALEDEALEHPSLATLARIRGIRRELMLVRRVIWPTREMLGRLVRDDTPAITDDTRVFWRDIYDHAVQLLDITDNYRELASGLMDVYLSSTGNRMNEIMKVLTIVATIFIPLTFVAGIYGMNFDADKSAWNMPELRWAFGYVACLALMAAVGAGMLFYFWRIGWIGNRRAHS